MSFTTFTTIYLLYKLGIFLTIIGGVGLLIWILVSMFFLFDYMSDIGIRDENKLKINYWSLFPILFSFCLGIMLPNNTEMKVAACAYAVTEFSNSDIAKKGNEFAIKWLEQKTAEILEGDDKK